MALDDNIQLHNFPDASLPAGDGDFLYLSQANEEKKITILDLADKFELVDIFGLVESNVANGDWFAFTDISIGLDTDANRKVSASNLKGYMQEKQHYPTVTSMAEADTVVKRVDGEEVLKEITTADLRDDMLNFSELDSETVAEEADVVAFDDTSVGEPKKINITNFRQSILDPTNLNLMNDVDSGDYFLVYDSSSGAAEKLDYADLYAKIDLDLEDYVTIANVQTVTGAKTFSSIADFSGNIKTDVISESTIAAGVTIDGVLLKDLNVTANNFYGILRPDATLPSRLRGINDTDWEIYNNVQNGFDDSVTLIDGDFLEVYGNNASGSALGGIVPATNNGYVLGTNDKQFRALYANEAHFENGISSKGNSRFSSLYINNNLLASASTGVVYPDRLPTSDENDKGAIRVASSGQMNNVSSKRAVTPWSIDQAHTTMQYRGAARDFSNNIVPNSFVYGGSIRLGGILINYGYISFTASYNLDIQDFQITYLDDGMHNFSDDTSYAVMLTGEMESGSDNAADLDYFASDNATNSTRLRLWTNKREGNWQTQRIYFCVIGQD